MEKDYVKKLVIARLEAMPPNVSFSIGGAGTFSRNDLINEVRAGSRVGEAAVELELEFLRAMPRLAAELGK